MDNFKKPYGKLRGSIKPQGVLKGTISKTAGGVEALGKEYGRITYTQDKIIIVS